ncbi:nuclease A inhibitor family protein [Fibrella sp. HMF5335]|uniref:Nuclease A inhibitor family protein n=1 Tax=Fibrella rubiginis TaxID=2817060 RepID=A0A939GEF0_9BACT|nr:nuclease A inhibitor family protein [Fibrella rubiginis]MBO0936826.1 nuclease A inhibitor family protein [Fibrella rubiginis]
MTPQHPERNADSEQQSAQRPFSEAVAPLLSDLLYPSESDEPIEPVETYLKMAEPLTASHIKDWLMLPPSTYVEEQPEADFWAPVTTIEDWFGDDEKATAAKFHILKTTLETTLTNRQVFRVGNTEIDVYLLGKPAEGEPRVGIKTKVVET